MHKPTNTTLIKSIIAVIFSACVYGGAQAAAESRPDYCSRDHDHRSHNVSYYDYYEKDKYYRAGPYRSSRSSKRYDDRNRYSDRRYNDRRYNDRRYNDHRHRSRYNKPRSRVVNRQSYQTRYRARVVLVEEIYYTRSGREQLVCSVLAKGPEAYYVPRKRLRRIARRDCSQYARIQYL